MTLLRALVAMCLLTGLCGCSSNSQGSTTATSSAATQLSDVPAENGDPKTMAESVGGAAIVHLQVPATDAAAIAVAMDRSLANCMRLKGFRYVPIDLASAAAIAKSNDYDDIAKLPIDSSLESSGYRMPPPDPPAPFNNDEYARSLGLAQMEAWSAAALGDFGNTVSVVASDGLSFQVPKNGCLTEARTETFGSLETAIIYEAGLSAIDQQADAMTRADRTVIEAISAWSACMEKSTGHRFHDFTQARAFVRENKSMNATIASADAACATDTGLAKTYLRVRKQHLETVIDANIGRLEAFDSALSKVVERIN